LIYNTCNVHKKSKFYIIFTGPVGDESEESNCTTIEIDEESDSTSLDQQSLSNIREIILKN